MIDSQYGGKQERTSYSPPTFCLVMDEVDGMGREAREGAREGLALKEWLGVVVVVVGDR